MNESDFNPNEQHLIDQMRQAAPPPMRPAAADKLRAQLFAEVDRIWPDAPETPPAPDPRTVRCPSAAHTPNERNPNVALHTQAGRHT